MMKLYKKTIVVSKIMAICFFILSVVCEFFEFTHKAIIQSYTSGIACSLIVVIVTTYLQFKYEQERLLDEIASNLNSFFFHRYYAVRDLLSNKTYTVELWEYLHDMIENNIQEISDKSREIRFFNKETESKVIELCGRIQLIQADCLDGNFQSKKKALEKIVFSKNIDRIEELAFVIVKEGFYKDNIVRFSDRTKEILKAKKNANAEKEDHSYIIDI